MAASDRGGRALAPPRRRNPWRPRQGAPLGVSDVVATILILALTVVLASAVFLFVTTYPQAPVPQNDAFALNLTYGGKTCVSGCGGGSPVFAAAIQKLSITLVAGPSVTGASVSQSSVRLGSQQKPFSFPSAFTIASGLGGSNSWSFGQNWAINLTTYGLPWYDNISVGVTSLGKIVLQTVTPGSPPNVVPYFTSYGVTPNPPAHGTSFTVYCWVIFPMNAATANPVQLNLSKVPGQSGLHAMANSTATPQFWSFTVSGGASSAGSFDVYVIATDLLGQRSTLVIPIIAT